MYSWKKYVPVSIKYLMYKLYEIEQRWADGWTKTKMAAVKLNGVSSVEK